MTYVKENKVYADFERGMVRAGARAYGIEKEGDQASLLEVEGIAAIEVQPWVFQAKAEGKAHAFQTTTTDAIIAVRAFGVNVGVESGFHIKALVQKDKIIGAEAKLRATLIDAKGGPFNLHLGAGVSTGAKIEDGTIGAKLAGTGIKIGKTIGFSVFDNEFSIDTLALFGKGWIW